MTDTLFPALINSIKLKSGDRVAFGDPVLTVRSAEGQMQELRANSDGFIAVHCAVGDAVYSLDEAFTVTPAVKQQSPEADGQSPTSTVGSDTDQSGALGGVLFFLILGALIVGGWFAYDHFFGDDDEWSPPPVKTISRAGWGEETGAQRAQDLGSTMLNVQPFRLGLSEAQRSVKMKERFVIGRAAGGANDMLRDTENGIRMERWEIFGNRWRKTPWFDREILSIINRGVASWVGLTEESDGKLTAWVLNATTLYGLGEGSTVAVPLRPWVQLHFDRDASFHVQGGTKILIGLPSATKSIGTVLYWRESDGPDAAQIVDINADGKKQARGIQLLEGGPKPKVLIYGSDDGRPWWAEYEISGAAAHQIRSATLPKPGGLSGAVRHILQVGNDRVFVITRSRPRPKQGEPNTQIAEFYVGRWQGADTDMAELWGRWFRMKPPMQASNMHYSAFPIDVVPATQSDLAVLFRTRARSTKTKERFNNYGVLYVNLEHGWDSGIRYFDGDFDEDFIPAGMVRSDRGVVVFGGSIYNQFGPSGDDQTLEGNQRAAWFEVWK